MPGDLAEHAKEPPEFVLASDLEAGDGFEIANLATLDADEIPGDYPQYGTFIECSKNGVPIWVECPHGLAKALVVSGIGPGDRFLIKSISKNENGNWTAVVDV
jgi:hypothetical protein